MIFYFSGTGNTRWAASQIAAATGDTLIPIPNAIHTADEISLAAGECIGFCFPVHGWRPPKIVREFISKLTIKEAHYTYAVITAGDNIGETAKILEADLDRAGLKLHAATTLIMPESYVGLPFMDVDKPEKEARKLQAAEQKLKDFLPVILNRQNERRDLVIGNWPRINSRVIGGYFVSHLITDKPFHVDSSKCVKCGICADVCPVQDITGGLGYEPTWKHNGTCLTCFACYHHCPHHAIAFGKRTQRKGQYFYGRKHSSKTTRQTI